MGVIRATLRTPRARRRATTIVANDRINRLQEAQGFRSLGWRRQPRRTSRPSRAAGSSCH
eukprot:7191128-Pyramimonas_sp.AAC.1